MKEMKEMKEILLYFTIAGLSIIVIAALVNTCGIVITAGIISAGLCCIISAGLVITKLLATLKAEGEALRAEGEAFVQTAGEALRAEGEALRAEGEALRAEGEALVQTTGEAVVQTTTAVVQTTTAEVSKVSNSAREVVDAVTEGVKATIADTKKAAQEVVKTGIDGARVVVKTGIVCAAGAAGIGVASNLITSGAGTAMSVLAEDFSLLFIAAAIVAVRVAKVWGPLREEIKAARQLASIFIAAIVVVRVAGVRTFLGQSSLGFPTGRAIESSFDPMRLNAAPETATPSTTESTKMQVASRDVSAEAEVAKTVVPNMLQEAITNTVAAQAQQDEQLMDEGRAGLSSA